MVAPRSGSDTARGGPRNCTHPPGALRERAGRRHSRETLRTLARFLPDNGALANAECPEGEERMTQAIVVPLDGEAAAEQAVPTAAAIARATKAPLALVHVHGVVFSPSEDATRAEAEYLDRIAERSRAEGIAVHTELLEGNPAQQLPEYIERQRASLIVLATEPKSFAARFLEGSVTEKLIRDTGVPILLLRPTAEESTPHDRGSFRHVLVPVDGSAQSEDVLEPLLLTGVLRGARCTLLHVVEQPLRHPPPPSRPTDAAAYLAKIADRLEDVAAVNSVVRSGSSAADEILAFAADTDIDLLALSTHGEGGLTELLFGSTAMKLVRSAELALLIHRPTGWRKD